MKFKKGDVVTIKSLEWYENEKDAWGEISIDEGNRTFNEDMSELCGKKAKIEECLGEDDNGEERYLIDIDEGMWVWIDWMFEDGIRLIKKKNPKEPIVISKNYILSDKLTSLEELEELAKNKECVAWKHSDIVIYTTYSASFFMNWSYGILKTRLNNMYKVIRNDKANMIVEALSKENIIHGENVKKAIDITRKILNKNE